MIKGYESPISTLLEAGSLADATVTQASRPKVFWDSTITTSHLPVGHCGHRHATYSAFVWVLGIWTPNPQASTAGALPTKSHEVGSVTHTFVHP